MIIFMWSWYYRNAKYVYMKCMNFVNDIFDYILLHGILSNPQWSFGWPPVYSYEWVDNLQDWVCFATELLEDSVELPLIFCSSHLCLLLFIRCWILFYETMVMYFKLEIWCWDFITRVFEDYCILMRYYVCWFSVASFMKLKLCMFWENGVVAPWVSLI